MTKTKMDYIKQANNISIETVNKPRVYLKWENTEKGKDKKQCYERVSEPYTHYINQFNISMIIDMSDNFFKTLEDMYNSTLNES